MSHNNGTGFWVVAALIVAMSAAALIDATVRFASRTMKRLTNGASTQPSRGCCAEDAGAGTQEGRISGLLLSARL